MLHCYWLLKFEFDAMDDFFRKVFPKNNILALREDVVEDDGSDVDVILVSPFQDFGIDSLLAEQIWSYLDGIDFMVCIKVNRVIFLYFIFELSSSTIFALF